MQLILPRDAISGFCRLWIIAHFESGQRSSQRRRCRDWIGIREQQPGWNQLRANMQRELSVWHSDHAECDSELGFHLCGMVWRVQRHRALQHHGFVNDLGHSHLQHCGGERPSADGSVVGHGQRIGEQFSGRHYLRLDVHGEFRERHGRYADGDRE
jgi:hypothetical protein